MHSCTSMFKTVFKQTIHVDSSGIVITLTVNVSVVFTNILEFDLIDIFAST